MISRCTWHKTFRIGVQFIRSLFQLCNTVLHLVNLVQVRFETAIFFVEVFQRFGDISSYLLHVAVLCYCQLVHFFR